MALFGPEHLGGLGDLSAKLDAMSKEERESGGMQKVIILLFRRKHLLPLANPGLKLFFRKDGKLLKIPGLPPMYDYELAPQLVCKLCMP